MEVSEAFSINPPPPPPPPTQAPPPPPPATNRTWSDVTPDGTVQVQLPTFEIVNVVNPSEDVGETQLLTSE